MIFELSYNNFEEILTLPVNPGQYQITGGQTVNTTEVIGIGEVNQIGANKLRTIEITSFFPKNYEGYCNYESGDAPYVHVEKILKWQKSQRPIKLIITDTPIHMPVAIQNFTYSESGGSGNVDFTLSLVEYKFLKVKSVTASLDDGKVMISPIAKTNRPQDRSIPNYYTTKYGDTVSIISKKLTGTFANAEVIYSQNKNRIQFVNEKGTQLPLSSPMKAGIKLAIHFKIIPQNQSATTSKILLE
ncbi:phage baseplate protein [Fusibacter sp. 3D3]|uniref:phage baseplate protein n=1 Tax=Fusibacter sp. 3D3 TaxID=1048380 RepID=UPI000852B319|nr:hypothetical protein [Fusibacter sp. 3D3]GAU79507.1 phage-like element PBSX protein xkdP [Fusibacter sp. 3D3]